MLALSERPKKDGTINLLTPHWGSRILGLSGLVPFICPATDLILSVGISSLDRSLELVVIPFDHHEIIVCKRTPRFLELSFELIPFSFEVIGIHPFPPCEM